MDQEEIIGFEALYRSMQQCKKGVMWKGSVAHYVLNGLEETYKLSQQLKDGTYKPRAPSKFTVYLPKQTLSLMSAVCRTRSTYPN